MRIRGMISLGKEKTGWGTETMMYRHCSQSQIQTIPLLTDVQHLIHTCLGGVRPRVCRHLVPAIASLADKNMRPEWIPSFGVRSMFRQPQNLRSSSGSLDVSGLIRDGRSKCRIYDYGMRQRHKHSSTVRESGLP